MSSATSGFLIGKKSFNTQFYRCVFTNGIGYGLFIRDLCGPDPVFNTKFLNPAYVPEPGETPFVGVRLARPEEYIPESKRNFLEPQPPFEGSYDWYLSSLKHALQNYLIENIDDREKYLFSHSSGTDSRFISGTMADLRRRGIKDFKNVHFRCHSPENELFIQIMKAQGWPEDQYSIFEHNADCYGIGVDNICVNGWCSYSNQMNYWSDIIKDEKDWIIITGEGGELFKYIARYPEQPPAYSNNYHLNMLIEHNPGNGEWDNQNADIFKDAIMPLWSYEYLTESNRVRREFIGPLPKNGWDNIRLDLVKLVGMDGFEFVANNHETTWKIPETRKAIMQYQFYSGAFYRAFKDKLPSKIDFFSNPFGWESKLWGFAVTVYDKIVK